MARLGLSSLESSLFFAIKVGSKNSVEFSLGRNVNVNARDSGNQTPLMRAAAKGNLEICRMLVDHNADLTLRDGAGRTAEQIAFETGHLEVVDLLHEKEPEFPEAVIFVTKKKPEPVQGGSNPDKVGPILERPIKKPEGKPKKTPWIITVEEPKDIVVVPLETEHQRKEREETEECARRLDELSEEIRNRYPDTLEENRLLNHTTINLFMEIRPRNKEEFLSSFPAEVRLKIASYEARDYLQEIFWIF